MWDIFLYEGFYIIYTILYIMLKLFSKTILKKNFDEVMYFWKEIGYQITDIDEFIQAIYKHRIKSTIIEKYEMEYDEMNDENKDEK